MNHKVLTEKLKENVKEIDTELNFLARKVKWCQTIKYSSLELITHLEVQIEDKTEVLIEDKKEVQFEDKTEIQIEVENPITLEKLHDILVAIISLASAEDEIGNRIEKILKTKFSVEKISEIPEDKRGCAYVEFKALQHELSQKQEA